jgi:hypothetical protein
VSKLLTVEETQIRDFGAFGCWSFLKRRENWDEYRETQEAILADSDERRRLGLGRITEVHWEAPPPSYPCVVQTVPVKSGGTVVQHSIFVTPDDVRVFTNFLLDCLPVKKP